MFRAPLHVRHFRHLHSSKQTAQGHAYIFSHNITKDHLSLNEWPYRAISLAPCTTAPNSFVHLKRRLGATWAYPLQQEPLLKQPSRNRLLQTRQTVHWATCKHGSELVRKAAQPTAHFQVVGRQKEETHTKPWRLHHGLWVGKQE